MEKRTYSESVALVEVQDVRVAVLEHRGDPALIGNSVRAFIAWRKTVGLSPAVSATFNILYDNPFETAPEAFRLDLCAATQQDIAPNEAGVVAKVIPGGRCAVLRYVGADHGLAEALSVLCADWLPRSGERLREFPIYCQRVRFFPEVPEHEAITDLFLPLRSRFSTLAQS